MAICGCGYDKTGNKITSCKKHRGKHHVSPRYAAMKKAAAVKKKVKKKGGKKPKPRGD